MEISTFAAASLVVFLTVVITWIWKVINWVWIRPKKLEKLLRQQGLKGNPYRIFHGDLKDLKAMVDATNSRPIDLSDDITSRVLPFHRHIIDNYGKNSYTWMGPVARVNVMEPKLIKEILTNNKSFKKPPPIHPLANLLVAGLSSYNDQKWAKHRKIINPAFHMQKLKNMFPLMYMSCSEVMKKLENLFEKENGSVEVDVQPYLEDLSTAVISRTLFGNSLYEEGMKIFRLQKDQAKLTRQVLNSSYIPGWRFLPTKKNRGIKTINSEVINKFKDIIAKRRKVRSDTKEGEDGNDDLLSLLLKSNSTENREKGDVEIMNIDDVIQECKLFYFAGQESTANLLTWTLVLLSIHQEWQTRAREEVNQLFGNSKPNIEGIGHLKVISMILHEVLRLYPPSLMFIRSIDEETRLGNMTLPAGLQFLLPIILVHHDEEIWGKDAKMFKPERFSNGVAKATKNDQIMYFPFSWGPRICVGNNFALLEAKLALVMILQRFSFKLSPSYSHAPTYVVTLQPQSGVHLILEKL